MSLGDDIRKDADGNVIGCPHCGARSVHKSGFLYRANTKKQQWKCTACGRKTVAPTIKEKNPFEERIANALANGNVEMTINKNKAMSK